MGLNKNGESGSSEDLLALLQRLKDSVSDIAESSHANREHGWGDSTYSTTSQPGEKKVEPVIYLGLPTNESESDSSSQHVAGGTDSPGSFDIADNSAPENGEATSSASEASETAQSEESSLGLNEINYESDVEVAAQDARSEQEASSCSKDVPQDDGDINPSDEGGAVREQDAEEESVESLDVSSSNYSQLVAEEQLTSSTEELEPGRPERYANPTRTIAVGGSARNRQRVVSNSNLVGAPPPPVPAGGYPLQKKSRGRIKELIKDPIVAVLVLIFLMVFVFVVASLIFVLSGSSEVQRVVPLPSSSVIQGAGNAPENTITPPTVDVAAEAELVAPVEDVLPAGQVVGNGQALENPSETSVGERVERTETGKGKKQDQGLAAVMPDVPQENYRWIVEIAAVTKQSEYERLIVQLQKDGFHPLVRVEVLPSGVEAFRLEIREKEMNEALVRMSQLKRLKYIDPKNLVMKPAQELNKK